MSGKTLQSYKDILLVTASMAVLLTMAVTASADIMYPDQILGVRTRIVDDEDPLGMRIGAFKLRPILEIATQYDDNIFRTETNTKADFLTNVRPGLALQSQWRRHQLYAAATGDFGYFKDTADEDFKDYAYTVSGQYDIAPDTYVTAGATYTKRHQSRTGGNLDVSVDSERGDYETFSQVLGFTRAVSFLKLKIFARNSDTEISDDGVALGSNDFIDRSSQSLTTVLSYDYMPGNGVFLSNTIDRTEYTLPDDFDGTSEGLNWRAGLNFNDGGGLWGGNLYGGLIQRQYNDGTDDTNEPYVGGTLNYSPSVLTQLTLTLDRQFTDTTSQSAAGIIRTTRRLELKKSITPLITGKATLGYDGNDYVGATSNGRKADFLYGSVGADYQVTDGVAMRLGYDYRERKSNRENDNFEDNRVLFSVVYNH